MSFQELNAGYEELNLIQIMTYIHPLQMMIQALRAQMGSKALTRVPLMKLHLQICLKIIYVLQNSVSLQCISVTESVSSAYCCKKNNKEQTI